MMLSRYLKPVCVVIVCMVLIFVCCGCQKEKDITTDDEINGETVKIKKLNIDALNYLGISGEYFYYMSEVNYNSDVSDYDVMRYDLNNDEAIKIGEIKKLSTWSNTIAFVGSEKLYASFGVIENNVACNAHTKIDLKSGGVDVLSNDSNFPPLIQTIAVDENYFVEYQPKLNEDGTYHYVVRLGDINNGSIKDIIVRRQNVEYSGESIVDVCVYANTIYAFEYAAKEPYVCSYDLSGNQITKESVDYVNEFLSTPDNITGDTETMWSIDVINGYYFFESLNGKRLVLHKADNGWTKRDDLIMNRVGSISNLIDDFNARQGSYTRVVLYDYNTEQLSYLDTVTGEKINLNIELPGATYCMTDGKQLIYANEKQELYYIEDVYAK